MHINLEFVNARTFSAAIHALHSTNYIGSDFRARIFCPTRLLICRVRHWNQKLKLHELKNSSFLKKSICDMLIANLVSISGTDCPSNEYIIKKRPVIRLWFAVTSKWCPRFSCAQFSFLQSTFHIFHVFVDVLVFTADFPTI